MKNDKFEWQEATSAPDGYLVDVYMGGLQSSNVFFTSLYGGNDFRKLGRSK
ncbi:MAG: hypothetical protein Q4C98_04095 [Capnocytophaga sp.]|nr:hypothetical protein [Capnocytophaga sp.]